MHPTEQYELERLIGGPITEEVKARFGRIRAALDRARPGGGILPLEFLAVIAEFSGALPNNTEPPPVLEGIRLGAYLSVRDELNKREDFQGEFLARGEKATRGLVKVSFFGDADEAKWVPASNVRVLAEAPTWAQPKPLPIPVEGSERPQEEEVEEVRRLDEPPPPTERFKAAKPGTRFLVAKPGEALWSGQFRSVLNEREILIAREIKGKGKKTTWQEVPVYFGDVSLDDDPVPSEEETVEV